MLKFGFLFSPRLFFSLLASGTCSCQSVIKLKLISAITRHWLFSDTSYIYMQLLSYLQTHAENQLFLLQPYIQRQIQTLPSLHDLLNGHSHGGDPSVSVSSMNPENDLGN